MNPDHHDAAGARFGELGGIELPRHYGNPAAEYRAAREGAAVVDRLDRAAFRLSGRDPVKMLDGLATNDMAAVGPEQGVYAVLLTPKGKMVAEVRAFHWDDGLLIETARVAADALVAHVRKYVPPLFAKIEMLNYDVLGIYGPAAADALATALAIEPPVAHPEDATRAVDLGGPARLVRTRYAGGEGYDLVLPSDAAPGVWDRLVESGAVPMGHSPLDVLRIEAGRPRWGAELDDRRIPLEAGLRRRAISESKGCYTGQEVIVRILHRGHVNWHLRRLEMGEAPAPTSGAELVRADDGKTVGVVTSACASPQAGQTLGLGYVRREVEPGATVRLREPDGPEVVVRQIPATVA